VQNEPIVIHFDRKRFIRNSLQLHRNPESLSISSVISVVHADPRRANR
jgi:hypothetical protein